ncbi:MAG: hypothetical protein E2O95_02855 [Acidobacteria bacterium]|nr:MAG: hypothetical protein E2O95_02855 [Acidobacteriota bacterium]
MSDVAQLMRAANLVPDSDSALTDDEFDALLLLTQTRNGNMDVQERTKPVQSEKKQRNGWLVAAAAFAIVMLFVGAATLLAGPAAELPPATTPPTTQAVTPTTEAAPPTTQAVVEGTTATTVAPVVEAEPVMTDELLAFLESYEAAFNNADEVAFRALHTADARLVFEFNPGNNVTLDRLVEEMLNLRRQETILTIEDCIAASHGAQCNFVYSGPVETALWLGPVVNTNTFYIDGGQITEIGMRSSTNGAVSGGNLQDSFELVLDWVERNFPEDRRNMIRPGVRDLLAFDDSELWLKYAPLWAEAGRP